VKDLVMALFGAQYAPGSNEKALSTVWAFVRSEHVGEAIAPSFTETAAVTDNRGFYNEAIIAYWPSIKAYADWTVASGFQQWWDSLDAKGQQHGWFREVFLPTIDRVETVYTTTDNTEGFGHLRESSSGMVQEHAYWGSMRERLPISQVDELVGEDATLSFDALENGSSFQRRRVRITGKNNLCMIRSGQNWSMTQSEERKLYLDTLHPVMIQGMDFLRDHGDQVGCFSCRFMEIINPATGKADLDRTFGLAYFDDIASLERWSKEHQTHLKIFGGFFQFAKKLDNNVTLQLFHEVMVLKPEQQLFEYVGCHAGTGMLTSLSTKA
jgi:hypothetical protein